MVLSLVMKVRNINMKNLVTLNLKYLMEGREDDLIEDYSIGV